MHHLRCTCDVRPLLGRLGNVLEMWHPELPEMKAEVAVVALESKKGFGSVMVGSAFRVPQVFPKISPKPGVGASGLRIGAPQIFKKQTQPRWIQPQFFSAL